MFDNLNTLVNQLNDMHQLKIKNGHYPSCRDARYTLQQMIKQCKELRKELTENTYKRTALTQPEREVLKAEEKADLKHKLRSQFGIGVQNIPEVSDTTNFYNDEQ